MSDYLSETLANKIISGENPENLESFKSEITGKNLFLSDNKPTSILAKVFMQRNVKMLHFLLSCRLDPNFSIHGQTMHTCICSLFNSNENLIFLDMEYLEMITLLFEYGLDPNYIWPRYGIPIIFELISDNNFSAVVLYIKHGANFNVRFNDVTFVEYIVENERKSYCFYYYRIFEKMREIIQYYGHPKYRNEDNRLKNNLLKFIVDTMHSEHDDEFNHCGYIFDIVNSIDILIKKGASIELICPYTFMNLASAYEKFSYNKKQSTHIKELLINLLIAKLKNNSNLTILDNNFYDRFDFIKEFKMYIITYSISLNKSEIYLDTFESIFNFM